jgi:hypothetical protein
VSRPIPGPYRSGMAKTRRRRQPPQPPAAAATPPAAPEEKPGRSRRFVTAVWAALLSTGALAAVVTVLVNQGTPVLKDKAEDVVGAEPLTIHTTLVDDLRPGPTRIWALPEAVDLATGDGAPGLADQLAGRGATSLRETRYGVTVENQRSETATVTFIRAVPVKTAEPLAGTVIDARTGGGPTDGPVTLRFELDDLDLHARDAGGGRYLDATGLVIAPGEVLRFELIGATERSYVEWRVEFGVIVNDRERTVSTSADPSFRTTGISRAYAKRYGWSMDGGLKPCAADCRDLSR